MSRVHACVIAMAIIVTACASEPGPPTTGATPGAAPGAPAAPQAGQPAAPAESPAASSTAPVTAAGSSPPPASAPAAPAAPEYRDVEIPVGAVLAVTLNDALATDSSQREDSVRATVRKPVAVAGVTVLPAGASVLGSVTGVDRSGRVKGRARLAFQFHSLEVGDERYAIRTAPIVRVAQPTKKEDAKKIGIGAGAGAVVGGLAGGRKGAGVGALIGGGAGTGAVLATRGDEVRLEAGTALSVRLAQPVTVRVRVER